MSVGPSNASQVTLSNSESTPTKIWHCVGNCGFIGEYGVVEQHEEECVNVLAMPALSDIQPETESYDISSDEEEIVFKPPQRGRGTSRVGSSSVPVFTTASSGNPASHQLFGVTEQTLAVEASQASRPDVVEVTYYDPPPHHQCYGAGATVGGRLPEPQLPASERPRHIWKGVTFRAGPTCEGCSKPEVYLCMLCPFKHAQTNTIQQHCKKHFPPEYACRGCDRHFHMKTEIQAHLEPRCHICPANSKGVHPRATKSHLAGNKHMQRIGQ